MTKNKKHIFIVNPASGKGKALDFVENLEIMAKDEGKDNEIEILETTRKGHATAIANYYSNKRKYSAKYITIYSVGGDGTLNEVINGMNSTTKLGIIPAGSGNDFYRIYEKIEGTKTIDLGIVNDRKFINIASLGIDAKMANRANEIKSGDGIKLLSYPRAIIEEIMKYKPLELNINGELNECSLFTLCNGKYYGSGFPMNPNYDLNNGLLNMITAGKLTRREIIVLLLKILKETHLESPKVSFMKGSNLTIESKKEILCNVDGEIIKGKTFEFGVIKDGITLTTDVPQYVKRAIKTIK